MEQHIETFTFGEKTITIIFGDITKVAADALVSSDDNHLTMSGGVSMAIRDAGGETIWEESRKYIHSEVGTAVVTSAGNLSAKYVLHALVIDYDTDEWPDVKIVQNAVKSCLEQADQFGCRSIAMPALATGAGGLSSKAAAQAVIYILLQYLPSISIQEVKIVLDQKDILFDFFRSLIAQTIKAKYEEKFFQLKHDKEELFQDSYEKHPDDLPNLSSTDQTFKTFTSTAKTIDSGKLEQFLNQFILNRQRDKKTYRIDSYCMSVYENRGNYENALKIAEELLDIHLDPVVICSVFRICRKIGNYERAKKILDTYPDLLKKHEFNLLYELVYYFEAFAQLDEVRKILERIEKQFPQNISIQTTVRNFYLKLGFIEDVERVKKSLANLRSIQDKKHHKGSTIPTQELKATVQESEEEMLSQILEQEKRLTAISELTRGISHEFGQPITNIRFTIQFYRDFFKGEITKEILFRKIFDPILTDTERMGRLNDRLSPITSSQSFVERFDVIPRIQQNMDALAPRLQTSQIHVNISPIKPIFLKSDPVKFDQLINNLLLNAIDAIEEKKQSATNQIDISVEEKEHDLRIMFTDTGKGIPPEHRKKIFHPFFSTKDPGKGDGLGLFIIWNILKMQGGTIVLVPEYENGTRFVINIPKETTLSQ